MRFEDYPLRVPKLEVVTKKVKQIIAELNGATTSEQAIKAVKKMNRYYADLISDMVIISVRYSIDTNNEIYAQANEVLDEISPYFSALFNEYNLTLVGNPFRPQLEETFGTYLFAMLENQIRCFDPIIIDELQKENKLTTQYEKILASAQIPYRGEIYNLSQIGKFMQDKDRETRKTASKAYYKFFEDNEEELADIYDQLVQLRDNMAKKLGFKNFIELGYRRLGRLDYDADDVAIYREQIYREVVPVVKKLKRRQAKRLGLSTMYFYDEALSFLSGNPKPIGDREFLVTQAQKMYKEMGKETDEFFTFMVEKNLLDLDAKPGKQGGGYMTYIPRYKAPFIFANFNGTAGDVDVLTHEVGHAFQGYASRKIKVPEYQQPTLEACEIHSMSMEFFAKPYIEYFFGDDADKYRFSHLEGTIEFLPYGVAIDEFQAYVYQHPEISKEERNMYWRSLEKKYLPWKKYTGFPFLEKGTRWMRQAHIYRSPFYYIDYTLAQVVAFQFAVEMQKNHDRAWRKYLRLCKLGGRYPFVELLAKAKLRNPFEDGNVRKVIRPLVKELQKYDDSKF
ncbi:MAG: M3 family oligoendopeptidase [Bacilli bacterium]|jgi:M3 family oligoendopeptidase